MVQASTVAEHSAIAARSDSLILLLVPHGHVFLALLLLLHFYIFQATGTEHTG
jgi:hypothetical protein